MTVYSQPSLMGAMRISPEYQVLGAGLTDRLFIIGHADLPLNEPHQVVSIQETVNLLEADDAQPLLRALFEAYFSGARDIWLIAAAPMSEYEPDISARDTDWYQIFKDRLQVTLDSLLDWDLPQVIVVPDAPFYDSKHVDFLVPLANHCGDAFRTTGAVRVAIVGTLTGAITDEMVTEMEEDPRLQGMDEDGKFVCVVVGEGVFNLRELPVSYQASVAVAVAAELTQIPYNRGITYHKIRNVARLSTRMPKAQTERLAEAKLNPCGLTAAGERGRAFETVTLTDNTLGMDGTDYWSLVQVRLIMHTIDMVRALGRRHIGTVGYGMLKQDISDFFENMKRSGFIKDYNLNIDRDKWDLNKVNVDVSLTPYFGVRQISFIVDVGPGK